MSETPKSDTAIKNFIPFAAAVQERLERGKRDYGDTSFDRDPLSLVEEIRQELYDVCGWAFVLSERLREIENKLANNDSPRTGRPSSSIAG